MRPWRVRRVVLGFGFLAIACAGCDLYSSRTPDTPAAEVVANQCDRVRSIGSMIAVGEAFIGAVEAGDDHQALAHADRAMDLWYDVQMGVPFLSDNPDLTQVFWDRQERLAAELPRVEWFAMVMNASPLEDAAGGTGRMLPEMRAIIDRVGPEACAVVELPSPG